MQAATFSGKGIDGLYRTAFIAQLNIVIGCAVGIATGTLGSDAPPPAHAVKIKVVAMGTINTLIFITNLSKYKLLKYNNDKYY